MVDHRTMVSWFWKEDESDAELTFCVLLSPFSPWFSPGRADSKTVSGEVENCYFNTSPMEITKQKYYLDASLVYLRSNEYRLYWEKSFVVITRTVCGEWKGMLAGFSCWAESEVQQTFSLSRNISKVNADEGGGDLLARVTTFPLGVKKTSLRITEPVITSENGLISTIISAEVPCRWSSRMSSPVDDLCLLF